MMKEKKIVDHQKKKHLKLLPSSPLPRINMRKIHSQQKEDIYFPSIKYKKIKTQESRYNSSDNISNKNSLSNHDNRQQQSKSFRLISRFIYNHLRKKINYQAQYLAPAAGQSSQNTIRNYMKGNKTSSETQPISFKSQSYKYTSPQINHNNISSYTRPDNHSEYARNIAKTKIKNRIMQSKYRRIQLNELKKIRSGQKGNSASIDSYFDLSCLDQCS